MYECVNQRINDELVSEVGTVKVVAQTRKANILIMIMIKAMTCRVFIHFGLAFIIATRHLYLLHIFFLVLLLYISSKKWVNMYFFSIKQNNLNTVNYVFFSIYGSFWIIFQHYILLFHYYTSPSLYQH